MADIVKDSSCSQDESHLNEKSSITKNDNVPEATKPNESNNIDLIANSEETIISIEHLQDEKQSGDIQSTEIEEPPDKRRKQDCDEDHLEIVNDEKRSKDVDVKEEETHAKNTNIKDTHAKNNQDTQSIGAPQVKCETQNSDGTCESHVNLEAQTDQDDSPDGDSWQIFRSKNVKPKMITGAFTEFDKKADNFLKGCKWAPDGTCLLTNSDDNVLRLFNLPDVAWGKNPPGEHLPEMHAVLRMPEGGIIYDYAWSPTMNSQDPGSCRLVCSSRDAPVHMYDAYTGRIVASYRAYDQADELTSAHSLAFSADGRKIYTGYNKTVRVFDVARPGRQCTTRKTFAKTGQSGIISCLAVNPAMPSIYAAGSYARTVALYMEPDGAMLCMFEGQVGGVTHLQFSPDGTRLYTGGRKDCELLCWDLRSPGRILHVMQRSVSTNQRVYFSLDSDGRFLVTGDDRGDVVVWDTTSPAGGQTTASGDSVLPPNHSFSAHNDTVNGVSVHPTLPLLATASGQRHFPLPSGLDQSDSEGETPAAPQQDSSVKLWWCAW